MTDVIAERAADAAGASVYVVRHPDHYPHHLPSALYRAQESELLADFLDHVEVVSLAGYGRIGRSTQLLAGGRNRTLATHLAQHVAVRGYQVVTDLDAIPAELRGLHPDNPVNRVRGSGTQLELSPRVRRHDPQPVARRRRAGPRDIRAGPGARRERALLGTTLGLVRHAIIVAVFSLFVFTVAPAHAQTTAVDDALGRVADDNLPGGVAVVRDGATLARHAAGYSNVDARTGFVPHTHIRAASITKPFVAATLCSWLRPGAPAHA